MPPLRSTALFVAVMGSRGAGVSAPAVPTGLSATPISTSRIDLAWTDNATNETGYRVYRSTDGANYSLLDTIAAGSTSYSDTTITVDVTYYYKVAAYGAGGESLSDAVSNAARMLDGAADTVAAWSLRQLRSAYAGNCVRLRRSTDNAESDFGFSGGWLDMSSVTTWLGGATGYVKTIYDQGGAGLNATQTDTTKQGTLVDDIVARAYPVVRFGSTSAYVTGTNDRSTHNKTSLYAVFSKPDASNRFLIEHSANTNSFPGFFVYGGTSNQFYIGTKSTLLSFYTTSTNTIRGTPGQFTAIADMSLSTNEASAWINGAQAGSMGSNNNNTGNYGNHAWYLGGRGGSSSYFEGELAEMIVFNAAHDTSTRQGYEAKQRTAFELDTYYIDGSEFADNAYTTLVFASDNKEFRRVSDGARLVYETTATSVDLELFNDIYGSYPTFTEIGVRINDADSGVVAPAAIGATNHTYALSGSGTKTVELIIGAQSNSLTRSGTFIRGIRFNASATRQTPVTSPRIVVYGDSIGTGANASDPSLQGWAQLVRNAYNGSLIQETSGSRTLRDDCIDATARTAFTAHLSALSPSIIWIAIGTNDYGGNVWNAASFGTAYADLLDKLHAALPSATIYAQTPIVRATETANGSGNTLNDYRSQIVTAQSTRSAYCTLVDGTAILTLSDLADGVHPTTAGQATYAAYVKNVLGLT